MHRQFTLGVLHDLAGHGGNLRMPASRLVEQPHHGQCLVVVRLELSRPLTQAHGPVQLVVGEAGARVEVVRLEGIGIEPDGVLELGYRIFAPSCQVERESARGMCFRKIAVERQRFGACGQNAVNADVYVIVQAQERIAVGDAGVGARVLWIELDGLREHAPRQLVVDRECRCRNCRPRR